MTALRRVGVGSTAAWCRLLVGIFSQIIVVPLYISCWDPSTYGVWLALQALVGLLQISDTAYQDFLEREFLKSGPDNISTIREMLYDAFGIALILGGIQFSFAVLFTMLGGIEWAMQMPKNDVSLAIMVFLIYYSAAWWLFGSIGGIAVRVVSPFGHYPRMAWWGVLHSLATTVLPAITVLMAGDLLAAGIAYVTAIVLVNLPICVDLYRLFIEEGLSWKCPNLKRGFLNYTRSLMLIIGSCCEMARRTGVRLIIAPLVGAASVTAFSTMRTGANVALQGLGTITGPLQPELMRFLRQRDQTKVESAFATVWLIVLVLLAPTTIVLQLVVEPLFMKWTNYKVPFDPLLFALLSTTVLVFAAVQPAAAIVHGNNLLRSQLLLKVVSSCVAVGLMITLVPWMGLRGAGIALVLAEIVSGVGYTMAARNWLAANRLEWPKTSFHVVALACMMSSVAIVVIAILPPWRITVAAVTCTLLMLLIGQYWLTLPVLARDRGMSLLSRVRLP